MKVRTRRILLALAAFVAAAAIGITVAIVLVARSDWFREQVRTRIITEAEKATGGRVEIGKFDFNWRTLEARVEPFALHGKEKPGEPTFFTAASIQVTAKIVSVLKKDVDVALIIVDRPQVHIIRYPDGTTNIPEPKIRRQGPRFTDRLLRLAVNHFELRNGIVEVSDRRIPIDVRGDNLQVAFDYDGTGPRYTGRVSSRQLHINEPHLRNAVFDFDSDLVFESERLLFSNIRFDTGKGRLQASGSLHDWGALAGEFDFEGRMPLVELAKIVPVLVEPRGEATVQGKAVLSWPGGFKYRIDGSATGRGLVYRDEFVRVDGISVRTDYRLAPGTLALPNIRAAALGGTFQGRADIEDDFDRIRIEGEVGEVGLDQITHVTSEPRLAWSGSASGPVRIDGIIGPGRPRDFTIQANMNIQKAPGAIPVEGHVDLIYDQRAGSLRVGDSLLNTGSSEIAVSGTLGQNLRVRLRTSNLDDLLPGMTMIDPNAPKSLPVKLTGGVGVANVAVSGPLKEPVVSGRVSLDAFEFEGHKFDRLAADVTLNACELVVRNIAVSRGAAKAGGEGRVELREWKIVDASALTAKVQLRGADLKELIEEAGRDLPVTGMLTASAGVQGTVAAPDAEIQVTVISPAAYGETFEQLRAAGRITADRVTITSGALTAAGSRLEFSGEYQKAGENWNSGDVRFRLAGDGFALEQIQRVRAYDPELGGRLALQGAGTAHVRDGVFDLATLASEVTVGGITVGASPVGNVTLTGKTRGDVLEARIDGAIRGSKIHGAGDWTLRGDYPGAAEIQFSPMRLAALHEIGVRGKLERELPFAGTVEGRVTIRGPLKKTEALRAEIVLPRLEVLPNRSQPLRTEVAADLFLHNTEPVRMTASTKQLNIQVARFAGKETSLQATGRLTFDSKSPWDVVVRGQMSLEILQLFSTDLLAQGNAVMNMSVQGALSDPQVGGKLELNNASLYLRDLPSGIDNANGLVSFDRNRANIEKLTAEVGGGRVAFGGFVGFASGLLLYRVQGTADQVRIRHPEGVSVTVNALLNLTGTSANSLISGTVTVLRASFAPRTDLGNVLAESAQPLPTPAAPNEYLRGLNFDVRVESGPSLEFQTSLTRDVQADAELRLRGNAARPILLGDISASQGEVQFFGTKYTINRGEIHFLNPTKIEPVFDVDLETKARGIVVNISFSGTLNKLNLTYRSDPPLQTNDIIALLAVGRDPTTSAFANAQARSNLLQSGANTLGQAIAAPVSSRLQRFFGVSRLKIDPQLTGVENIPQARLTLEQQVSRDVTLTYITNLTRTQEQLVRVQWDINRRWSVILIREESGVVGVDFQYKKRLK